MAMCSRVAITLLLVLVYDSSSLPVSDNITQQHIPGAYIVVPRRVAGVLSFQPQSPGRNRSTLQLFGEHIENLYGGRVLRYFEIGSWKALLYQATEQSDISPVTLSLEKDEHVEYTEPNMWVRAYSGELNSHQHAVASARQDSDDDTKITKVCLAEIPGDSRWGLSRMSSREMPNYSRAPYLFTDEDMGTNVDVYVVDTGVRKDHVEFKGDQVTFGYKASGIPESEVDLNGHGTHIASLAVGATVGVAKDAKVVSVKVLNEQGAGQVSWILEGLAWISNRETSNGGIAHHRSVINLSLGVLGVSYALDDAVQAVVQESGIPVAAAAGNDYGDACLNSPGRMASVITVASTTRADYLATFSNYGPCVNIMAPGEGILGASSAGPDLYAIYSGTSQSTGYVSGILARYLSSVNSTVTPAWLQAYITDMASYGYVSFTGTREETTPNRLVYGACESMGEDMPRYRPVYPGYRPLYPGYDDVRGQIVRVDIVIPVTAAVVMAAALLYITCCNC